MKKLALFALVLLVSLPGCRKDKVQKQSKKQQTEQHIDTFSADQNDFMLDDEDDYLEDDDLRTLFDFDEDAGEFVAHNDEMDMDMDSSQDIAWIDTETDDDLQTLYFEFNKSQLNDNQKQALKRDVEQIKQLLAEAGEGTKAIVVAEGHTCQEGSPEYNLALSENRAKTVADLLVSAGVDADVIKIVGRGQDNPVVEGKTRAERAPNRRVELRVIYT